METNDNDPSALIQLVYVSAATVRFGDAELDNLLAIAREKNAELDVTGMLLFESNTFFQVLEGERRNVQLLYEKIERDSRHNNVLMLAKREIPERNFGQWRMGFVRDKSVIEDNPGFDNFFSDSGSRRTFIDLQGDKKRIEQILDGFRRGRWRRGADVAEV